MSTLDAAINASASALNAERTRIEVAVSNMANAESTRGPDGRPYRRRDVILTPTPDTSFDNALSTTGVVGVQVQAVVEDTSPFRRRYDPSHPDANAEGFVEMAADTLALVEKGEAKKGEAKEKLTESKNEAPQSEAKPETKVQTTLSQPKVLKADRKSTRLNSSH